MYRLQNPIQHYRWGGRDFIPALLGIAQPVRQEYAELWMGAHPNAPSRLRIGAAQRPLSALVAADPVAWLGARLHEQFGAYFPFLFKVLSVNQALSIQAHPSAAQARAGYQRAAAAGLPADSPTRIYQDPYHKPELMCALTPFWALCGFRPPRDIAAEYTRPPYQALASALGQAAEIATLLPLLLARNRDPAARAELLRLGAAAITAAYPHLPAALAAATPAALPAAQAPYWWALKLMRQFPDDLGALAPLYLNLIQLPPAAGLYIGARTVHAYLYGNGIELMANSDNVLRAGLSVKHIDADELLRVVDLTHSEYRRIPRRRIGGVVEYPTPAVEFLLVAIAVDAGGLAIRHDPLPKILLCLEGEVRVRVDTAAAGPGAAAASDAAAGPANSATVLTMRRGESLFCLPSERAVTVQGAGRLYMALPATEVRYRPA